MDRLTKTTPVAYSINPRTVLKAEGMTVRKYVKDYQPYITVDEELIQRLYEPWVMKSIQSYLLDLVSGNAVKDLLLIADIESIINQIDYELQTLVDLGEDTEGQEALKENIEYFQSFIDEGKKYLLIDGKHRDEVIRRVFTPKTNEEVITFDHESFSNLIFNKDKVEQNIVGKSFGNLPDEMQHAIFSQPLLVTLIKSGSIIDLQNYFVTTNSGLQLYPMEIRIASMSVMGRFVRNITSKIENPTNHKFFGKMSGFSNTGKKARKKKGHMLLVSQAIAYYLNRVKGDTSLSFNYTSEDYLDEMYEYKFPISKGDRKLIETVVKTISLGALELYSNVSKKHKKGKYIKVSWSSWINYFIMISNMFYGNTPFLKSIGRKIGKVNNHSVFFNDLTTILNTLEGKDLYELDAKGNKIPKMDKYGVPMTKKNKPVYIENEHSFKRKNTNMTPKNVNDKQVLMLEEVDKYLESWDKLNVITLVEQSRSLTQYQKRQTALNQGMKDAFTGGLLTWADVDTGATANSHTTAYSEGGSEMVVGNADSNRNSKTEKVY
tara:strand:- start:755 stop:2398 length:1644 start_codon:yes stop_codon:yes gene_type:complete